MLQRNQSNQIGLFLPLIVQSFARNKSSIKKQTLTIILLSWFRPKGKSLTFIQQHSSPAAVFRLASNTEAILVNNHLLTSNTDLNNKWWPHRHITQFGACIHWIMWRLSLGVQQTWPLSKTTGSHKKLHPIVCGWMGTDSIYYLQYFDCLLRVYSISRV